MVKPHGLEEQEVGKFRSDMEVLPPSQEGHEAELLGLVFELTIWGGRYFKVILEWQTCWEAA